MTWYADTGTQAQNLVSQISTRLQNGGWTLYDNVAGAPVLSTTNTQGAACYLQVSQVGSYTYIQLQSWKAWNAGTHAGTSGSSTSYARIYIGGAAQGATVACNLYMSVTANRAIIFIDNPATMYRNWGYFGGLGTLAGTNDPNCALLISSFENANSYIMGQMLLAAGGSATYWAGCVYFPNAYNMLVTNDALANLGTISVQGIGVDSSKPIIFPIICCDVASYPSSYNSGIGPPVIRGDTDGLLLCPLGNASGATTGGGQLSHMDTITVGAKTYLVIQPGGETSLNTHPFTGNYLQGLAIEEA